MNKLKFIFNLVLVLLLAGFAVWTFAPSVRPSFLLPEIKQVLTEDVPQSISETISNIEEKISEPGPLVAKVQEDETALTRAGVISLTNEQRRLNGGLRALAENSELNAAAEIRLKDMFEKQYFAHEYPGGIDVAAAAKTSGYEYVMVGENIALGNFGDDAGLVQAWMDSPGHRANIVNTSYTEIGVAVAEGTYEGRKTWIGVQVFGKPAADCPKPSVGIKSRIDLLNAEINELGAQTERLGTELDEERPQAKKDPESYNRKVDEYNGTITVLNGLVAEAEQLSEQYNAQAKVYNACVSG